MSTLGAGQFKHDPALIPRHDNARSHRIVFSAVIFVAGVSTGLYLQHRWPLGRLRDELQRHSAPVSPVSIAEVVRIPRLHRLVIVAAGQSNAANYGASKRAAGAGVYAFADGLLYPAVDPLPGGDGIGGSVWSRLGAKLAMTGDFRAIIFAITAQGSSRADEWAPGGRLHDRLDKTLRQLAAAGLPVDFILWQQGESEGSVPTASGQEYFTAVKSVQTVSREIFPHAQFLAAEATYAASRIANEQIRLAQARIASLPGGQRGPDLDQLGSKYRSDGIHFNDQGLIAAAELWFEALCPLISLRAKEPDRP